MQGKYFIALKKIFSMVYGTPNQSSFDSYFKGICGRESNSQFDY
jgi:hypothetical protein